MATILPCPVCRTPLAFVTMPSALACPFCLAAIHLPPGKLPVGKKVRCARCHGAFTAETPPPAVRVYASRQQACPSCDTMLSFRANLPPGKKVRCPRCNKRFRPTPKPKAKAKPIKAQPTLKKRAEASAVDRKTASKTYLVPDKGASRSSITQKGASRSSITQLAPSGLEEAPELIPNLPGVPLAVPGPAEEDQVDLVPLDHSPEKTKEEPPPAAHLVPAAPPLSDRLPLHHPSVRPTPQAAPPQPEAATQAAAPAKSERKRAKRPPPPVEVEQLAAPTPAQADDDQVELVALDRPPEEAGEGSAQDDLPIPSVPPLPDTLQVLHGPVPSPPQASPPVPEAAKEAAAPAKSERRRAPRPAPPMAPEPPAPSDSAQIYNILTQESSEPPKPVLGQEAHLPHTPTSKRGLRSFAPAVEGPAEEREGPSQAAPSPAPPLRPPPLWVPPPPTATTKPKASSSREWEINGKKLLVCGLAILLVGLAGYYLFFGGGFGRRTVYPTEGSVMYLDKPAVGARITLFPENQSRDRIFPTGKVGADGTFKLTTYETDDGAPAGRYKVTITRGQMDAEEYAELSKNHTPEEVTRISQQMAQDPLYDKYSNPRQSGLTAEITNQPVNQLQFKLN